MTHELQSYSRGCIECGKVMAMEKLTYPLLVAVAVTTFLCWLFNESAFLKIKFRKKDNEELIEERKLNYKILKRKLKCVLHKQFVVEDLQLRK